MQGRVVVVGAGISGLVAAHRLRKSGLDVTLLEAGDRSGGLVRTARRGGYQIEGGPDGVLSNAPATSALIGELGLENDVVPASKMARHRYLVSGGRLVSLPYTPTEALTTPLLPVGTKMRALMEVFAGGAPDAEESVAGWTRRRLGAGLLPVIDAVVTGVHAGDPERLSVDHAFPQIRALERRHNSVLLGALAAMRRGKGNLLAHLVSFRDGMETLVRALAARTGPRTGVRVERVVPAGKGFSVETGDGRLDADAVVVAAGARGLRGLLPDGAPEMVPPEAPVTIVGLGYPCGRVAHPLDGYGFLAPETEGRFCLGCLFPSTVFSGRAPDGHVLLRAFVGGVRHPERAALPDDRLIGAVRRDLNCFLGLKGEPAFVETIRNPWGISQLNVGHGEFLAPLNALEARHPGLFFCGLGIRAIAVNALVADAERVAGRVAQHLPGI